MKEDQRNMDGMIEEKKIIQYICNDVKDDAFATVKNKGSLHVFMKSY